MKKKKNKREIWCCVVSYTANEIICDFYSKFLFLFFFALCALYSFLIWYYLKTEVYVSNGSGYIGWVPVVCAKSQCVAAAVATTTTTTTRNRCIRLNLIFYLFSTHFRFPLMPNSSFIVVVVVVFRRRQRHRVAYYTIPHRCYRLSSSRSYDPQLRVYTIFYLFLFNSIRIASLPFQQQRQCVYIDESNSHSQYMCIA